MLASGGGIAHAGTRWRSRSGPGGCACEWNRRSSRVWPTTGRGHGGTALTAAVAPREHAGAGEDEPQQQAYDAADDPGGRRGLLGALHFLVVCSSASKGSRHRCCGPHPGVRVPCAFGCWRCWCWVLALPFGGAADPPRRCGVLLGGHSSWAHAPRVRALGPVFLRARPRISTLAAVVATGSSGVDKPRAHGPRASLPPRPRGGGCPCPTRCLSASCARQTTRPPRGVDKRGQAAKHSLGRMVPSQCCQSVSRLRPWLGVRFPPGVAMMRKGRGPLPLPLPESFWWRCGLALWVPLSGVCAARLAAAGAA